MKRRKDGRTECGRRDFLGLAAVGFLSVIPSLRRPAVFAQESTPGPSGRLVDPSRAGRPRVPTTARDTDAAIQAIEKRLRCTCGCNLDIYTCRTTDFTCGVSPEMHRQVVALADAGKTGDEIVADFVARHGEAILMAPPPRGFNLAAYFVPSLAILAAAAALVVVLRRWSRRDAAMVSAPAPAAPSPLLASGAGASAAELERLRRELDRFPG
ncbi:MAG: cytochrome c-type biogenesis protein [Gemmatimonadales bacterium]